MVFQLSYDFVIGALFIKSTAVESKTRSDLGWLCKILNTILCHRLQMKSDGCACLLSKLRL